MWARCLGGFSVMWVTKLLISPVKIRIFCPKKSKFGPKMAFLFILGQALPAHLVGGCGARPVSRKTPIYFIFVKSKLKQHFLLYIWSKAAVTKRAKSKQNWCDRNAFQVKAAGRARRWLPDAMVSMPQVQSDANMITTTRASSSWGPHPPPIDRRHHDWVNRI